MNWQQAAVPPLLRGDLQQQAQSATPGEGLDALTRELTLLRLQLSESSLAGEVFANPWFHALGALGTLLVAASFFVEAGQRIRLGGEAGAPPS